MNVKLLFKFFSHYWQMLKNNLVFSIGVGIRLQRHFIAAGHHHSYKPSFPRTSYSPIPPQPFQDPLIRNASYLLSFNEPDHSCSYIATQQAATKWDSLVHVAEQFNLTLVLIFSLSLCARSYAFFEM